jgi:glutathione S-transferase
MSAFYKGKHKAAEIEAYWYVCKEVKTKGKGKGKDGKGKDAKGKGKGKGKVVAEPKAKAKAKAKVKAKAGEKTKAEYKAKVVLYTNAICPFAHRAAFATSLCALDPKIILTPLSGQLTIAEKVGMEGLTAQVSCAEPFKSLTAEQLKAQKEEYKKNINASGEVPSLTTTDGNIIIESEIVAEFIDKTSKGKVRLMPPNPVLAAKIRLAMKRFNDVVGPSYGLLMNQDPAADAEKAKTITDKLAKFAEAIDKDGSFCFGDKPTLADVHCGPFLYRFKLLLDHYRGFDYFADQPSGDRLAKLLTNIVALPEFNKLTPITEEGLIQTYNAYANQMKFADAPTKDKMYGGRGKSEFGK